MLYDKKWDTPAQITPALELWQQTMLEAAEWLRNHNWTKGLYRHAESDSSCMIGAVLRVQDTEGEGYGKVDRNLEIQFIKSKLALHLKLPFGVSPEWWNDRPGRSKEEVIDVLETVALKGE